MRSIFCTQVSSDNGRRIFQIRFLLKFVQIHEFLLQQLFSSAGIRRLWIHISIGFFRCPFHNLIVIILFIFFWIVLWLYVIFFYYFLHIFLNGCLVLVIGIFLLRLFHLLLLLLQMYMIFSCTFITLQFTLRRQIILTSREDMIFWYWRRLIFPQGLMITSVTSRESNATIWWSTTTVIYVLVYDHTG